MIRKILNSRFGLNVRMYHQRVIDHYENPRNVGSLDKNNKKVGTGLVGAPAGGDVMKLQILVEDNGKIINSVFRKVGKGKPLFGRIPLRADEPKIIYPKINHSRKIIEPIIEPTDILLIKPFLLDRFVTCSVIFNIITTKRNKTATAPT